ncbi:hypothetical protein Mal52_60530 [Symmachiella dynata]|uniref:Uncharacterized protein n=1 Tax=Symmachiella dynata TaxID=2527995 RepID=A0A517ZYJ7_9PLAN|nr:hypothetical protein Mal52_60530 [Symmachiella dynata]
MNRDRFGTLNNPEIRLVKRQHSQRIFPLLRGFSIAVVLVCLLGAFIAGIIGTLLAPMFFFSNDIWHTVFYVLLYFGSLIVLQTGFLYMIHRTTGLTRHADHDAPEAP